MKKVVGFLCAVMLTAFMQVHAQVSWQFNNGPYYALIDDFAAGLVNGQVILYAADSSEHSLMKSTNRGESWTRVLSAPIGYVRCVATFSSNANIVYAGIMGSGIFKSTDGGITWPPLPRQPENLYPTRIAIHPTNPDIVWVGCQQFEGRPVLYRSVDGGGSWQPFSEGDNFPIHVSVSDIALAENTDYAWVSTYGTRQIEGVWRTLNGGAVWSREITGMDYQHLASLAIDPRNPDVLYAGTLARNVMSPRKIYKTTNATGAL